MNKIKEALIIIIFPTMLYGILGPLEIYAANFGELKLDLTDFFIGFCIASAVLAIVLSFIVSLVPAKVRRVVLTIVFSIAIASYMQGMLLNGKIMMSDGSDMDWSALKSTMVINSIEWVAIVIGCIIGSILLKEKWDKAIKYVSIFISLILFITTLTLIITTPKTYNQGYQLDEKDQFVLAKSENIIVIVLDRYGNDRFESVAKDYPEIKDCLKDFTYYNNADSRYSNTYPSMPHIMTGQYRDYSISTDEWLSGIWDADSTVKYYNTIHNDGYQVHLYSPYAVSCYGLIDNMIGKIDNIKTASMYKDYRLIYTLLEKATMYKYGPYVAKPRLEVKSYVYDQMVVSREPEYHNSEFYDKLINEGLSVSGEMDKCIAVHHLLGLHNPFEIDEYAHKIDESAYDENVHINVTRGLHVILAEYFNQLKELGLYDSATIIVTADHGDYSNGGGLQPIFFIKRPYETRDEMAINSAPISHDDFVPTILYLIGEDYSEYGTTIFDWNPGDRRARMIDDHEESTYYTDKNELYRVVEEKGIQF